MPSKAIKNPTAPAARGVDRRDFLKYSALIGGSVAACGAIGPFLGTAKEADAAILGNSAYTHHIPENQLYSCCQQCNTNCGIKVKLRDGVIEKIEGNPFNPWNMTPQIPENTPIAEAALIEGSLCPKGHSGIQTLYDPYRIVQVLKRTGKRGENKWKTLPFDQAVQEIVNGGDLFGEGLVEGLKDIVTLRDPKIAAALADDAKLVAGKKLTIEEFKTKHADNLHHLIDPDHPDLGPKNNQFCFNWGRIKNGRGDLIKDFFSKACGSVNYHGHTTVCQGSLYFSGRAMSDQFNEGKFTGGSKFYWQADTGNAEFCIFVGANPFEANYGPPLRVQKITEGTVDGRMKIAVIDPRCSKTASRAWKWLPVEPVNGVPAIAMALIQWIIDNKRYDARYLANANKGASKKDGEPTWSQAAWLVRIGDDGTPGKYLRGSDLGLEKEIRPTKKDGEWEFDAFATLFEGQPVFFDPNDETNPVEGELFVDTTLENGIRVKSVLQIIMEEAKAKSIEEWCTIAGVNEGDVIEIAKEFTSHGKKAVADLHRGVSQHTGGFYNVCAWYLVNCLIGNIGWQGGLCKATTHNYKGDRPGKPFDMTKQYKGGIKNFGINIIRHSAVYDKTTLFEGFPAKRTWYPFSTDIYQEVIPSIGDMYPYQVKALLLYMGAPNYSLPSGHTLAEILTETKKLPLFIASDIVIGETSMYADYIFPDTTYLERWEFPGAHPSVAPKVFPIRQPVVAPLTPNVTVFGEEMPMNMESMILAFAEKLGVPGYGEDVFGPGKPMKREEDMYLRMVANVAFGDKEDGSDKVPAADAEEIRIFVESRRHLPGTVFDADRWKAIVGEELWPHVVYVLNRGGRFQGYAEAYKNEQLVNAYNKMVGLYFENMVTTKHSMTGKPFVPHAAFMPGPTDCAGNLIDDRAAGFDMTLITYKFITQTKSRTIGNYWLNAVYPENFVEISTSDARRMDLQNGDMVRVVSATNPEGVWDLGNGTKVPMIGKVKALEGIRPGVVAFSLGHGHWAQGSIPFEIDGKTITMDARRAKGFHANAAMRVDPILGNTTLSDVVGGSAVFYQSQVKLVKE
ncbi:Molybdopterin oxidoreductase Fe4S4 domain-containing protein [Desulfomicrobium apsheronum]|uniref:Molybdopterin oxidoreductase Fe4S4 domain-containing protein n=1 Tax=Desulfomicrobium apsheronum TaxID=52560 RepID=A0A1I3T0K2_9BACT|nr:molybdopterin-dependent oxidoreductase [Desulfomicrobium apsheronum]SFJ64594.1 Molybdopterin oxidoreductase Fe4S4 domain-containing protein [Desulfomicrobium apsheronum]